MERQLASESEYIKAAGREAAAANEARKEADKAASMRRFNVGDGVYLFDQIRDRDLLARLDELKAHCRRNPDIAKATLEGVIVFRAMVWSNHSRAPEKPLAIKEVFPFGAYVVGDPNDVWPETAIVWFDEMERSSAGDVKSPDAATGREKHPEDSAGLVPPDEAALRGKWATAAAHGIITDDPNPTPEKNREAKEAWTLPEAMAGTSAEIPLLAGLFAASRVASEKKTDTVPQSACIREHRRAVEVLVSGMSGKPVEAQATYDEITGSIKLNLEILRPVAPDVVVQREPAPATTKALIASIAARAEWGDECADVLGDLMATLTHPKNADKFGTSEFRDFVKNLAQRYEMLIAKRPQ